MASTPMQCMSINKVCSLAAAYPSNLRCLFIVHYWTNSEQIKLASGSYRCVQTVWCLVYIWMHITGNIWLYCWVQQWPAQLSFHPTEARECHQRGKASCVRRDCTSQCPPTGPRRLQQLHECNKLANHISRWHVLIAGYLKAFWT
jgi:hypothetical protein